MELSYNDLKKRDVINVPDGRCLGRITDLRLSFPSGVMIGIVVPGRKVNRIFRWFDKTEIYIDRSRIIKIGGDVILVDISCEKRAPKPKCEQQKPCPPKPPFPPHNKGIDAEFGFEGEIFSSVDGRIDTSDY